MKTSSEIPANEINSYISLTKNLPGVAYKLHLKSGHMDFLNNMLTPVTGYKPAELTKRSICSFKNLILQEDRKRFDTEIRNSINKKKTVNIEYRLRHKNGKIIFINDRGKPEYDKTGKPVYVNGVIFDITGRKESEEKFKRINRTFDVLSQINQAILRIKARDNLLKEICRIAVEFGKFKMAWIGIINSKTGMVEPKFHWGKEQGYLKNINISTKNKTQGKGPTRTAIRDNKIYICNDIENDPGMKPWKKEALKRGYKSSVAFPLKMKNKILASLTMYSSERNFFNKEEVKLLKEVSSDISFALEIFEKEEVRRNAERAIEISEERFRNMFESQNAIMYLVDSDTFRIVDANAAAVKFFGYSKKEFLRKKIIDLYTLSMPEIEKEIANAAKEKRHLDSFRHKLANGQIRDVELYLSLINLKDKKFYFAIVHDITEKKILEKETREWKERYEIISHVSGQIVYFYIIESGKILWSGDTKKVVGYSKREMGDINDWANLIHPSDRDRALNLLETAQNNVGIYNVEYRFRDKNGEYLFIRDNGVFLPGKDGKAEYMVGTMQDVTNQKRIEKAIRDSEEKYRLLFEKVTVGFALHEIICDDKGKPENYKFLEINPAFEAITGISAKDAVGKTVLDLFPGIDNFWIGVYGLVALTGEEQSFERYFPELKKYFYVNAFCPKKNHFAVVFTDISDLKNQQEKIMQEEERIAKTENFSLVMITHSGLDGKWLKVPSTLCTLLEFTEEELLNTDFQSVTHPDDVSVELDELQTLLNGTKKSFALEKRYVSRSGNIIWVYINCSVVLDSDYKPLHFVTYIKDITERITAQEKLKRSEKILSTIANTASDAIILLDNDGKISYCNPSTEKMFGYTSAELLGEQLHYLIAPIEFLSNFEKGFTKFRKTGSGLAIGKTIEFTAQKKDGTRFPIEVSTSSMLIDGKWHATGIVRDITERKQAEEIIKSSLREKEILLREVHHRVKNNLQVISSLLTLQTESVKDIAVQKALKDSQSRIKSIALLHEMYLTKELSILNFKEYISTLTTELFRTLGKIAGQINTELEIDDIYLDVEKAIPCGLIINELISNALKYAFTDDILSMRQGVIKIKMSVDSADNVNLIISDNGVGIPDDIDIHDNKTLGLQLVFILAEKQLKGKVSVNRIGGTTFKINFNKNI
jgi:PAS domain S-box-containing protein